MNRIHRRTMRPSWMNEALISNFRFVDRSLIVLLLACAIGCSSQKNDFNLDSPPPTISLSLPDGRADFQANESIPLNVVLTVPANQGSPSVMAARLMRGNVVSTEKVVPGDPVREQGTEKTYQVVFVEGLPKPGTYQAVVVSLMGRAFKDGRRVLESKDGAGNSGDSYKIPRVESEPIKFEVTK